MFKSCNLRVYLGLLLCLVLFSANSENNKNEFLDLKNYLSQTNILQAEAESNMRYMPPPYYDKTMLAGDNFKQLNNWSLLKKNLFRTDLSDWNTYNYPEQIDNEGVLRKHFAEFCSQGDMLHQLCTPPAGQAASSVPYDLNAAVLFEYPTLLNLSYTTSQGKVMPLDMEKAARYYIRNLTNPIPLTLLPDSKMYKNKSKGILTSSGKAVLDAIYKQQAVMSLAQESLLNIYADRLPYEPKNAAEKADYDPALKSKSRNQIISEDALRRYTDSDWNLQMNKTSAEGILREIANMMALQLVIEQRNSERLERIETMMAAKLGIEAQAIGLAEKGRQAGQDAKQRPDNL